MTSTADTIDTQNRLDMLYVRPLKELRMHDIDSVGGKNASLGELIGELATQGIRVPGGFATTAHAFRVFLAHQGLGTWIAEQLQTLHTDDIQQLTHIGQSIRARILATALPAELEQAIRQAYLQLTQGLAKDVSFAVRSSATAEDLPDASFAGQQETYLNIQGIDAILSHVVRVFASLYNDRAISYRAHKGFAHQDVALSVGVQQMIRSDLAASGVMFSVDTESGFDQVVLITSSYGLGECVVQGAVNPDEFYAFKPALKQGKYPILRKHLGSKLIQMVFAQGDDTSQEPVQTIDVPQTKRHQFSLNDDEVTQLAQYACIIEQHYGRAMDIEWAKDGLDGQLYILQARPETVKSQQSQGVGAVQQKYVLKESSDILCQGRAIGQKVGSGRVRILHDPSQMHMVEKGDILVADMTDPNWEPVMKRAGAIVTNRGGRTCHAAIIARELGVPAVVGCENATRALKDGQLVTVSCAQGDEGYVYDSILPFEVQTITHQAMPSIATKMMMNVGNPELAFEFAQMPNDGVGLTRLEFIINTGIGIHPNAIIQYPNIDADLQKAIERLASGYDTPRQFYHDKLRDGIATIAAAFYPKPVIVRMSDFKSNEYQKLIGGSRYEPMEENPMLGFRGASRYLSADFAQAFALECQALLSARQDMGLDNIQVMIPFVRTTAQAQKVIQLLAQHGLKQSDGVKIIMMCEVPSNAILAEEFLQHFDGFSIGSNDLTQLSLGLDRDSGLDVLMQDFDERDAAVKKLIQMAIQAAKKQGKYIGICGQGPSDHPDFATWLVEQGISSLSLNPDSVVQTWQSLASSPT